MTPGSNNFGNSIHPPQISVARIAFGIFLLVLAIYVLSSPGRIDIIDGQARFDVAYNWLHSGQPLLTDPWIKPWMAVPGRHNLPYSYYGAPASVLPMPLLELGSLYDKDLGFGASQFLFSLTSSILGAVIASVLFLFYVELGLSLTQALLWTMISSFATLIWPASTSTFDNAQQAVFALTGIYLGVLSAKRDSKILAGLGGVLAGILILYQPYFLIILPALALSTVNFDSARGCSSHRGVISQSALQRLYASLKDATGAQAAFIRSAFQHPGVARDSCARYLCFLGSVSSDVVLSCMYNNLRFGSFWHDGKLHATLHRSFPLLGNPLAGLLTLLLSPGKSVFLYSPPVILGFFGFSALRRRRPELAFAVLFASVVLILFLSCIAFVGGDWCWGPRYLVILLPLWALAFPFASLDRKLRRSAVLGIVGLGVTVQLLAVSVEHQRFFFERGFNDLFWAEDPWCYFKHSALFTRVGETISLTRELPPQATLFNTIPQPNWYTYALLGPPPKMSRSLAPQWMLHFKIFYLPRPWPFWMQWTDPDQRPIRPDVWIWTLLATGALGLVLIRPILKARQVLSMPESARLEWETSTL